MSELEFGEFAPARWATMGFTERLQAATRFYVLRGMDMPLAAYAFHALKVVLYVCGWVFFCSFTPGLGDLARPGAWIFEPVAFQKAFLWSSLVEVLGLSCMSGPLGLKIWPPFTAFLHFFRPGTIKQAPFPNLPWFGGHTRTWLDVLLYTGFVVSLVRALVQPEPGTEHMLPILVFLPLCALGDRTVALAARWEHHFAMLVCFAFAGNFIAACKWVQLGVWFWAGVSKCTVAFGYVVPIMTANNPLVRKLAVRRYLFKSFPDDLRPSRLGIVMAHGGTFLEFGAPLTLVFVTEPGLLQYVGVALFLLLHLFIISNMPLGAVFEWNVLNIYSGLFLFVGYPEVGLFAVGSVPLAIYLVIGLLVLPVLGNLMPARVSFLLSKRYYAGNWAWNAWLFHKGSEAKLKRLKRAAEILPLQQERFLPAEQAVQADASFLAFRALHLQGRLLGLLLPRATEGRPFQEYRYVDGEVMAGSILGWNFGEGHLSDERLVAAIQDQCGFEDGELRLICAESQPMLGSSLHWRVVDAKRGQLAEGHADLADLAKRAPWDLG